MKKPVASLLRLCGWDAVPCVSPPPPLEGGSRDGAALIVTLGILTILALLLSGFAFDMQIESAISSHARKRIRARAAAEAGIAYGRMLLAGSLQSNAFEETDETREQMRQRKRRLSRGLLVSVETLAVGDAEVRVTLQPEQGRRNVNHLTEDDWERILELGKIPLELRPEMMDCFFDWTDGNDLRRLHGEESDDAFYVERGYRVKNGPLDTLEELRWIKGFESHFLDGGFAPGAEGEGDPYPGILKWMTVWGDDNRVNINTASRYVLLTLPGVTEALADEILTLRLGLDGMEGTEDDGFQSVDDAWVAIGIVDPAFIERVGVGEQRFVRVTSIADVGGVRSGIWAVMSVSPEGIIPVYWREELMP